MTEKLTVFIEAELHPTEPQEKLEAAICNLIGSSVKLDLDNRTHGTFLAAGPLRPDILHQLYHRIRTRKTIAANRRRLRENTDEGETSLFFNRQALAVNRFRLVEQIDHSPLGAVILTLCAPNIEEWIDWLAPMTELGVVVQPSAWTEMPGGYVPAPISVDPDTKEAVDADDGKILVLDEADDAEDAASSLEDEGTDPTAAAGATAKKHGGRKRQPEHK